jgi:hypothetical protein
MAPCGRPRFPSPSPHGHGVPFPRPRRSQPWRGGPPWRGSASPARRGALPVARSRPPLPGALSPAPPDAPPPRVRPCGLPGHGVAWPRLAGVRPWRPPPPASPRSPLPALGARLRARAVRPRWLAARGGSDLAVAAMAPPARCPSAVPPARSPSPARPWRPAVAARPRPCPAQRPPLVPARPRRAPLAQPWFGPSSAIAAWPRPPGAASPRRPALPRPWRGLGASVARPWRGPGSPPALACPASARHGHDMPARRGLELGQRAAPRGRPRHGPVVARGAQCSVCAARPRRVRDPFATR